MDLLLLWCFLLLVLFDGHFSFSLVTSTSCWSWQKSLRVPETVEKLVARDILGFWSIKSSTFFFWKWGLSTSWRELSVYVLITVLSPNKFLKLRCLFPNFGWCLESGTGYKLHSVLDWKRDPSALGWNKVNLLSELILRFAID